MKIRVFFGILLTVSCLGVLCVGAQAQFYGPSYPPPGGVTLTPMGMSAARAGGLTWSYKSFAFSAYQDLYYGVTTAPVLSLDGGNETLTFSSGSSNLAGGVVVWLGSSAWCSGLSGTMILPTRMTLKVTDSLGFALPLTDVTTIPGFPGTAPIAGAVLKITFPNNNIQTYNANYLMEVQNPFVPNTWTAALDFYDGNHSCMPPPTAPPQVKVDLNAGFWRTDYPITAQPHSLRSRKGQPFTLPVASFTTLNPSPQLSNFHATINWGDGSNPDTNVTIVANGSGGFDIVGSHTYTNLGYLLPAVQINSIGGSTGSATGNARMWPRLASH